jgi:hypothetical protein
MYRIVGRRGSAFIPPLSQGVFSLRPFNPAEIKVLEGVDALPPTTKVVGLLAQ